ncbi:DUF5388 domain-containing protein [Lysinibacillus xylanilyticus]|uniref:DUF5388 domain-containing protein n=1 Tax=Lysinibacillus xylanilyticus TaxID=582475 RepID=UPI002E1B882F|nr:DUF5388 domain-containing protein [Lysinibacillus xylanilyticus]
MSNLLNNGKPKKRLLERGPKIVPSQEFKLEPADEVTVEEVLVQEQQPALTPRQTEATDSPKTNKNREAAKITSVRVTKTTRNKLNALIQLGKADNVDSLIDILLDEYIETSLVKDEEKTFNLILDIIQKRDR